MTSSHSKADCHVDDSVDTIKQLQKHVKVLVHSDAPEAGFENNVLKVQELAPADHVAAAFSM